MVLVRLVGELVAVPVWNGPPARKIGLLDTVLGEGALELPMIQEETARVQVLVLVTWIGAFPMLRDCIGDRLVVAKAAS
jgi:hypothetical protein